MPLVTREGIELAKVGAWNALTGKWNCTRNQLADAVRADQSGKFRKPVLKRGHLDPRFAGDAHVSADGEPALGQARNLRLANGGDSLIGDVLMPDWLDDEIDAIYPSRSVEADLGVETEDGDRFDMVLTGVALLGVTKPAIQSLADLPERVAAAEYTAAMSVAAGFWDEKAHPRGGKGTKAGGKFVAKGSGYAGKKDGQGNGDEADQVREVQAELIRLGLLSTDSGKNDGKDGLFGPKTEAAVKKWQTAHGHTADGKVSEQLLKTLKLAKKGDKGQAQKLADHPHKAATKRVVKRKVKAAADELAGELGLEATDVTDDAVIWTDPDGLPWLSEWEGEDDITIGAPAPAQVTYERVAASGEILPVTSPSGLGSATAASLGASSVDITQLREALGLDESADESAALAAIAALKSTAGTPPAPETVETVSTPAVVRDSTQSIPVQPVAETVESPAPVDVEALVAAKVAAAMGEHAAGQSVLRDEVTRLSTELAGRKQAEAVTKRETLLASAVQAGKIHPAARQRYADLYDASPRAVEDLFASLAPNTAFTVQASGYAGDDKVTSEDDAIFQLMGYPTEVPRG